MWCLEPNLVLYKTSRGAKSGLRDIEHPDIEHRDTQHPDIEHPGHWASKTLSIRTLSILGHWASETLSILGHWASRDIEHTGTLSIQGRHGARGSEMMFSRYIGNISIVGTDIWAIYRLVGRIYRWCIDYFDYIFGNVMGAGIVIIQFQQYNLYWLYHANTWGRNINFDCFCAPLRTQG